MLGDKQKYSEMKISEMNDLSWKNFLLEPSSIRLKVIACEEKIVSYLGTENIVTIMVAYKEILKIKSHTYSLKNQSIQNVV